MINITIYQDHNGRFKRISCIGHAEYAKAGKDIVCAAVSVLVINTLNALEKFTAEEFTVDTDQETGLIDIRFLHPAGHDAGLLIDTMVLGLQDIQHNYGTKYSFLEFKEV